MSQTATFKPNRSTRYPGDILAPKKWHQLDLILVRRSQLKTVLLTRSYHGPDCDTDHALVCCKIRIQAKAFHRAKPPGRPRINTTRYSSPQIKELLENGLKDSLAKRPPIGSAEQRWDNLQNTIFNTALSISGRKKNKNEDWFEASETEINPVLEEKRMAQLNYKQQPNQATLQAFKKAKAKVQRTVRCCANKYWTQLCESIQLAAENGNIRGVYLLLLLLSVPSLFQGLTRNGSPLLSVLGLHSTLTDSFSGPFRNVVNPPSSLPPPWSATFYLALQNIFQKTGVSFNVSKVLNFS